MDENPYEAPRMSAQPPGRTQETRFTNSSAKVLCSLTCLLGVCIMLAAVNLIGPKLGSLFQFGLLMTCLAGFARVVLGIFLP
jgi:hypothetical protein